ncbi:alpha/beta hydrolase [Rubrivivax sp. RP6-9]|uniref:alpha/beta hydrolase n=1 Tax=Rubrivivax sp. RP6-9 TaxID=3415750 RepID=UPI003CC68AF8
MPTHLAPPPCRRRLPGLPGLAAALLCVAALLAGCLGTTAVNDPAAWVPAPLADAGVMPDARDQLVPQPTRAVVLGAAESPSAGAASLGAAAVAATEQVLASAGIDVVDARLARRLAQQLALAEATGRSSSTGAEVADLVLRVELLSASTAPRSSPGFRFRDAQGRDVQVPARQELQARVLLQLRVHDARSLRLLEHLPAEGLAARALVAGAVPADTASLLREATADALRQAAGPLLAAVLPPAVVVERRVQGSRSLFRVLVGGVRAPAVGDTVQIVSQPIRAAARPAETLVVARGQVAGPKQADFFWVLVDDAQQGEAVRRGDRVQVVAGGAGLLGGLFESGGRLAGLTGSMQRPLPATAAEPVHVPVLFGTNRAKTGRNAAPSYFGASESTAASEQRLTLGRVRVSVPPKRRQGEIPRPPAVWVALEALSTSPPANLLGLPRLAAADPQRHFSLAGPVEEFEPPAFAALLRRSVEATRTKSALVYVHGFANSFEDAAFRAAQFSHDLADEGYDVAPVLFSWPSDPGPYNYGAASGRIWSAGKQLAMFLRQLTATTGAGVVHLVAHSQGAQVLGQALDELRLDGLQAAGPDGRTPVPRFREIVLAAPDIRAADFRSIVLPAVRSGHNVTNYVSSNDAALRLSGRVNEDARAGDAVGTGMLVDGVRTIDVTAVNAEPIGHSSFADSPRVIADIRAQLQGRRPEERRLLPVQRGTLQYWELRD